MISRASSSSGPRAGAGAHGLVGVGFVAVSAGAFAGQSVAIKLAYRHGLDPLTLAVVRAVLSTAVLWIALRAVRTRRAPTRRQATTLLLLGGLGGMSGFMLLEALARMPAGTVILTLYSYPALVAAMTLVLRPGLLSARVAFPLALSIGGLALMLGIPAAEVDPAGIALSIGAACATALFVFLLEAAADQVDAFTASTLVLAGTAVVLVAVAVGVQPPIPEPGGALLGWVALVAILLMPLAITAYVAAVARIGPTRTAIGTTLDPWLTVMMGAVFLGERIGGGQLAGGALVVTGAAILPVVTARRETLARVG